ncbi:response regulator [Flavitalea sp. BT771]|uniref:response regulator n=1 Tax=Flavitalea sp. BT771 TaxID=3063329 RepID=UPI0026E3D8F8|nr:response regulator [Flavitalea sp. BT771]MDO6430575.1 response regulator [Flavitalea sp. BT771]MDV6219285.1 response regulator [Flavitalea sp. BT771]
MARTVLLIDDDEDDAQFFSDAIKELAIDMTMEYCSGGQQALDRLTHNRTDTPDIIFLDLNMPALNGWECLREIKKIADIQHIPIVMYSTANLYQEGVSPEDVGAKAFYRKSNSFSELKTSLAALLRSIFPQ